MDKLAQLQTALRAIETGQRFESVDGVLVRQVLLQPRVQQQLAPKEPDAKDLYQELLALRKVNAKYNDKHKANKKHIDDISGDVRTIQAFSPKKTNNQRPVAPTDLRAEAVRSSLDSFNLSSRGSAAEKLVADTTKIIDSMQMALVNRNQELRHSEKAVARADAELQKELARAEKILPSNFLFERNLVGDRAFEAARNVLIRFQHRFFQFYFRHWWTATLALRLQIQRRAVAEIMRVYRGHWERRQARRLRRELSAMNHQKHQLLVFRIKYRASQAMKVQMTWRRFQRMRAIKQRQSRDTAACLLQKAFRTRQWRSQSLVNALAYARKLYVVVNIQKLYRGRRARHLLAESRRRQRQEEQVRLALLRNMSKQARTKWIFERRGAEFLIAHRTIFPYAMRSRWRRVIYLLRRQRAAKCIARAVCEWFGVDTRRDVARAKQTNEWLALMQREHHRSRFAAVLIQKHLRRWVQQRKFRMSEARRKKLAKRARLEMKARQLKMMQESNDQKMSAPASESAERKIRRLPNYSLTSQPAQLMSVFKSAQAKSVIAQVSQRTDVKAVIILQNCYRHYRARRRAQISVWQRKAKQVEARVLKRHRSATQIQRHVRGIQGRRTARHRRAERSLLSFTLRWRWRSIRKRHIAARKIGRWFKLKRTQQRAKLWRFESEKRLASTFRVQRWFRFRYLLPSRLDHLLKIARKRDETIVFCDQSLRLCRQHMADTFAVQSLRASLEEALRPLLSNTPAGRSSMSSSKVIGSPSKHKVMIAIGGKHNLTIVAFPVLQMVFLVVCGWKMPVAWRELDGKSLFQTKLERAKAVSFFRSLHKRGKAVASGTRQSQQPVVVDAASSPNRRNQKLPSKGAKGAAANDTFSSVEVDVAIARATGGTKGALDYVVFIRTLELLGEITLTQQSQDATPFWGRYDGSEARVLALLWRSLFQHVMMQSLASQFDAYVSGEMSRCSSCLQRFFGRRRDKLKGVTLIAEKRRDLRNQELSRAAVVLQKQARKILARRALRLRIRETYEKFLDPTWGLPYWMNPRSGYSTWHKPLRLGAEDVRSEPVPFPPPERTLKAHCNGRENCDRCAQWVCYDCDELFCLECFAEYHKSKTIPTRLEKLKDDTHASEGPGMDDKEEIDSDTEESNECEHELERLLFCGLCQFQLASRRCLDCLPKCEKPKILPAPQRVTKTKVDKQKEKDPPASEVQDKGEGNKNESLFCDVCFGFLHRRGGLRTHRTELLLEFCTSCSPNDDENLHQTPSYIYDLPGAVDAVQWECVACGDPPLRVCGRCALHSHPNESCGELHPVPLQTQGRRGRAKRLQEEQDARDRQSLDRMRSKNLQARQERCARKLQAFWRSHVPILRARRIAAALRKEKSSLWLHHLEDARIAKRLAYRAKNALGIAPPLSTDSHVERRLRSLNAPARRQLSIRARFFGLLVDEYVTVGIPLPGMGLLRSGSNELWTTEDLRGWIRNRQTLRLQKLTEQESEPAERALCAWRQLESWRKSDGVFPGLEGGDKEAASSTSSSGADSWFADIHAKGVITENIVPLAQSYEAPLPKKLRNRRDEEDDPVEDVPVAMFLVEFSLDPQRTVWINHSLAERFWEWKRLKLLARRERAAQRQRAAEYKEEQQEREAKRQQAENATDDKLGVAQAQPTEVDTNTFAAADPTPSDSIAGQPWPLSNSTWPATETTSVEATDPYYNYYASTNIVDAAGAWTRHNNTYTTDYHENSSKYDAYGYNSSALESSAVMVDGTSDLVDSGSYYYSSGDYAADSNGSNWYGTEHSAYNISTANYGPDMNSSNSEWNSYDSTYGSEAQPSADVSSYDYSYSQAPTSSNYVMDLLPGSSVAQQSTDYQWSGDEFQGHGAESPWEEVFDPNSNQVYYVNRTTNETAWQIPS